MAGLGRIGGNEPHVYTCVLSFIAKYDKSGRVPIHKYECRSLQVYHDTSV